MVVTPKKDREHNENDAELRRKSDEDEKRGYYYDDAHGYEKFVDNEESDDKQDSDDPISSDVR